MARPPRDLAQRRQQALLQLATTGEMLRGSLLERFLPCGKKGCRCHRGELHGPAYYLSVTYAPGKTRQVYVPKHLKTTVEQWLQNYQRAQGALEEISAINMELVRLKAIQ